MKSHTRQWLTSVLVIFVFTALANTVSAVYYDPRPGQAKMGLRGGVIWGADVNVNDFEQDTDPGVTGGFYLDFPAGRRHYVGLNFDLYDMQPSSSDIRRKFFDISMSLKHRLWADGRRIEYRPGVAVGFGYMASVADITEPTSYLTLRAFLEVVFHSQSRFSWIFEGGIVGSPHGGDEQYDVTFGPTVILRGGVNF